MGADGKRGMLQEPTVYRTKIKEWPADERPREKLLKHGAASLSDAEEYIVGLVIICGISRTL